MSVQALFQAYYDARRHKRSSTSALAFELNYESELLRLYDEIISGNYQIGPSDCFVCFKPVQREIFAAGFRDRVVHHFIFNYIKSIFERLFIVDSYSCRVGKGTSYGINRVDHFIRSCSLNYSQDCYILKLDIAGYFMSLDRKILYQKVLAVMRRYSASIDFDTDLLIELIHQVIFHDATKNCRIRARRENWIGLPKNKSLFWAAKGRGLPIGNLTSQLFGNVYLNEFDHFVKCKLGCRYYGRYVDDMVIVHQSQEILKSLVPVIGEYLHSNLGLTLHMGKVYLQHYSKGVAFFGVVIKPYRKYIGHKIKAGCYKNIAFWNNFLSSKKERATGEQLENLMASMNSYFGLMQQYHTYRLRRKLLSRFSKDWRRHVMVKCAEGTVSVG